MENLRTLFLIVALVLILIVVLAEVGSLGVLRGAKSEVGSIEGLLPSEGEVREAFEEDVDRDELDNILSQDKPPGMAIPYMALLDGALLFTVGLMAVGLLLGERVHARIQGVLTLLFSIFLILAAIGLIIAALVALLLRVALFLAVPFGTIAYLAIYGFFNRSGAIAALGLLMMLKLGFAACLALAQQRFLQNLGLVLIVITSLVCHLIIGFLYNILPRFLVNITDPIAAIIVAILAVIWALFLLVGSLLSVIKALRIDRV
jgi:hypothetical protein